MRWRHWFAACVLSWPVAGVGAAEDPVRLRSGPNAVDLDGDGRPDLVVKARRDNFNAHGFTHYAFYRHAPSGEWEVIPILRSPDASLQVGIATVEGADCILQDVRLLHAKRGGGVLVVAKREVGQSYRRRDARHRHVVRAQAQRGRDPGLARALVREDRREGDREAVLRCRRGVERGDPSGALGGRVRSS